MAESLTSYLTRLAEAHSLHLRTLVTDEVLPHLNQSHLYRDNRPVYDHLTRFWKQSMTLNGTSATSSAWVQAIGEVNTTPRPSLPDHADLCGCSFAKGIVAACTGLVPRLLQGMEGGGPGNLPTAALGARSHPGLPPPRPTTVPPLSLRRLWARTLCTRPARSSGVLPTVRTLAGKFSPHEGNAQELSSRRAGTAAAA